MQKAKVLEGACKGTWEVMATKVVAMEMEEVSWFIKI